MSQLDQQIEQAIDLLQQSQHAVVLTGAGISTPSGIPDFRSAQSGLWGEVDPMQVASFYAFKRDPQAFYDWIRPLALRMVEAEPNAAHLALAQLETHGPLEAVITQNIDMLHSKAGSKRVHEVHGHMREATCLNCYGVFNTSMVLDEFMHTGAVPRCPGCGGLLKPNVILYGELLPVKVMNNAKKQMRACDLLLVVGSSLEVAPAGDLPLQAKQSGANLIILNLTATHLDYLADVLIRADVVDVLPRLAAPFLPPS